MQRRPRCDVYAISTTEEAAIADADTEPRQSTVMERTRDLYLSERAAVACMLARAFANDPLAQYVFPEDAIRRKRLVSVYRLYLRVFEQKGLVSINDDGTAAALWLPPGRYPLSLTEHVLLLPRMMLATGVQNLPGALRVLTHLEKMHPVGRRFWYLGVLGVEPDRQGSGVGSALLATGLRICDHDKVGTYLETAEPRNLPFYAKFGFDVLSATELREGPLVWSVWREPAK